jgi:REP element-mobilizing transposase RayT
MPHRARAEHRRYHPVHLTMRLHRGLASLRTPRAFAALSAAIAAASSEAFRILQFTVQENHLHLMIEADGREALMAGAKGFAVRTARALNRALRRRGQVWGDRYHTRELTSPREVRNCYAYVLLNRRRHQPWAAGFDGYSSAPWFDGWKRRPRGAEPPPTGTAPPVVAPRTWLAATGWRKRSLIDPDEQPGPGPRLPDDWVLTELSPGR